MRNTEYNPKQVIKYLLWTFVIAYIIQFLAAPLYKSNRAAKSIFNPRRQENISLSAEDELIVIGEE